MEYLYKLETNYSYKEYKKYNWEVLPKKRFAIFFIIFFLYFVFDSYLKGDNVFIMTMIPIASVFLIVFLLTNRQLKKTYESNKLIQGLEITFEFYDTYFLEKTIRGEMKIEYCLLHKVIETKTNFYLMTSKIQGYILCKEQFPEGLENFLQTTFQK